MSLFAETWPDADYTSRWNVNYEDGISASAAAGQLALVLLDAASAPHWRVRSDPTLAAFTTGSSLTWYVDLPPTSDVALVTDAVELRLDGPYINVRVVHNTATIPEEQVEAFIVSLDAATDYGLWDLDPAQQWYQVTRPAADTIEIARAPDADGPWETLLSTTVDPGLIPDTASSRLELDSARSGSHTADYTTTWGPVTYDAVDPGPGAASASIEVALPALTAALQAGRVAGNLAASYDETGARVVLVATDIIARTSWITRRVPGGQPTEVRGSRRDNPPNGYVVHDAEFTSHVPNDYRLELRP